MEASELLAKESTIQRAKEDSCRLNGQESPSIDTLANTSVRQAATADNSWALREISDFLYRLADIFNREFFGGTLPQPVISFEKTRKEVLGYFIRGRNDQGLKFNINLNKKHLGRSEADLCETLVHEQIHLYQSITGTAAKPGYHNKAFVQKAASIGLQVELGRGCHDGPPRDPFVALLRQHGVSFEPRKAQTPQPKQERQRLRRWSCACKSVWCGGTLAAVCLNCQQHFVLSSTKGQSS